MDYSLDDFDFHLPEELIAQRPAEPRDHARLLVFDRKTGNITDSAFYDLDRFLPEHSMLVLNNARVDKCRLRFGNMEVFVLETVNDRTVRVLVRPGQKFKLGRHVGLAEGVEAEVTDVADDGIRTLVLSCSLDDPRLDPFRLTPLPPYIAQDESLADQYQTVYAKKQGSKAAPTAGLHFTPELLNRLHQHHDIAEITLHVGLGTFAPLREENIESHRLHEETFEISADTAAVLNRAHHITAVGTTSVRTLESAAKIKKGMKPHVRHPSIKPRAGSERSEGSLSSSAANRDSSSSAQNDTTKRTERCHFTPIHGATEIFIQPGYQFKAVDAMITNFHLPKTSLLMLVAAFMGYEPMRRTYEHAIAEKYRFYSFGDAMLIL